ncbi:ATP synthase subunit gamma, mitochondrial-like isoform X2 [Branchiostoma lanceolatum]|uniref:ATP synthase F(1) complex subunit gamma, mitochondrial n=1 Tax=Branchiostoma lanceolatum TaxID=7740 RepID=A0A8J9ZYA3_BRALA|nr:ATP5C1 [Branchiostoma lanceolatum]
MHPCCGDGLFHVPEIEALLAHASWVRDEHRSAAMLSRTALFVPTCTQVRGMATLKEIRNRLKSVKNVQKITQSMKMVSAAKYARAERELKPSRPYGTGAAAFYDKVDIEQDREKPRHLLVTIGSDRGLCGAMNSNINKLLKNYVKDNADKEIKFVTLGDKARQALYKTHSEYFMMTYSNFGRQPATFSDAAEVAEAVINSGYEFDVGEIYFNEFKSVVSYNLRPLPLHSLESVSEADSLAVYDSLDAEVIRSYQEYQLASVLYACMKETNCSEHSARMTAMDSATKNAGEMIDKLTLTFNRTRQAVITRELIEIISGAAAL